jgi:prepilin-type N-terminal cleavage/methylation domain-containing protein
MRTRLHHARGRQGFTLVESLIAVTLLAVLFLAVAQTSSRASDAFDEGSAEHALSTSTHRCLERIARAIEFSDGSILSGQVLSAVGAQSVAFRVPAAFDGGAVQWMNVEIQSELEGGELDDGVDNDGDGLIDERRVVMVEAPLAPDERRVILASGVAELFAGETANLADDNGNGLQDETGLSFSATAEGVVTIRLCCQRRDEGRRLLTKIAETAVRLRNN